MFGGFGGIRLFERFKILALPDDGETVFCCNGGDALDNERALFEITVVH